MGPKRGFQFLIGIIAIFFISLSVIGSIALFQPDHQNADTATDVKSNDMLLWSYPTGIIYSPPVVSNGIVYVVHKKVYALDALTGKKIWDYETPEGLASGPTVVNGVVYAAGYDGKVYALDAATGLKLRDYTTGGPIEGSSPEVANGIVYVGSMDHKVYAFNETTGAKLWEYTIGGLADSSPSVADGVVYAAVSDGKLYALNATSGEKLWDVPINYAWGPPYCRPRFVVTNGIIYGPGYALDATTGAQVWNYTVRGSLSSPLVSNGVVYLGSGNGKVYALDASTGVKIWNSEEGGESRPALANGVLFVWSSDGKIYAIEAATGRNLWNYTYNNFPGERITMYPVVANGILYLGAESAPAFGEKDGIDTLDAIRIPAIHPLLYKWNFFSMTGFNNMGPNITNSKPSGHEILDVTSPTYLTPSPLPESSSANQRDNVAPISNQALDPNLSGTWYLEDIELNVSPNASGNAPGFLWNTHYVLTFYDRGIISGYSGCNYFSGHYTLTGETMKYGRKGIVIGPLSSTQNNCSDISRDEMVYLNVLQNASIYETFNLSPYPGHDMPTLNLINKNNFMYYGRAPENWTSG